MNKTTIILFAVTALVVNLAAQEPITFSDFIAEDGSGIEKLLKLQKKRCDKKDIMVLENYFARELPQNIEQIVEYINKIINLNVILFYFKF